MPVGNRRVDRKSSTVCVNVKCSYCDPRTNVCATTKCRDRMTELPKRKIVPC
jgi:hypothetical protein